MKSTVQSIIESFSLSTGSKKSDWIKIKKQLTFDLVVGGYTPMVVVNGSLPLEHCCWGTIGSDILIFTGKVGSGISTKELEEISSEFIPSDDSQFFHPSSTGDVK